MRRLRKKHHESEQYPFLHNERRESRQREKQVSRHEFSCGPRGWQAGGFGESATEEVETLHSEHRKSRQREKQVSRQYFIGSPRCGRGSRGHGGHEGRREVSRTAQWKNISAEKPVPRVRFLVVAKAFEAVEADKAGYAIEVRRRSICLRRSTRAWRALKDTSDAIE